MKIRWEIGDGYAGKSRPMYTDLPDEDLEGLTPKEEWEYIQKYLEDDIWNCCDIDWHKEE